MFIEQNSTPTIEIFISDTSGAPAPGQTVHVGISKNLGSWASATNSVSDAGRGFYSLSLDASETDTLGVLIITAWVQGTDATWENQSGSYNEWRAVHRVYDALYVQTASGVFVNAALTEASWEEGADRILRRPTSEVESASHTGLDTLTMLSLYGVVAATAHAIETDSATTPATITVKKSDGSTELATRSITSKVTGTNDPNAMAGWSDS